MAALVKDLNQVISGPSIYEQARFRGVVLRPETEQLLKQNPGGRQLARLNKLLLEDAYPAELARELYDRMGGEGRRDGEHGRRARSHLHGEGLQPLPADVHDAARLRQSGPSGVRADLLQPAAARREAARCARRDPVSGSQRRTLGLPAGNEQQRRAGVYAGDEDAFRRARVEPGRDTGGRVEGNGADGRRAAARGARPSKSLDFKDPAAGKVGPIAWQMHNAGLFDEYKDVTIESDPKVDDLITVK